VQFFRAAPPANRYYKNQAVLDANSLARPESVASEPTYRRARSSSGLVCGFACLAQQNGRFSTLRIQAMEAFERGQFDQVAGKVEEIWEQDRSEPKVAEYLAMGYLYSEHNVDKATGHERSNTKRSAGAMANRDVLG
jgi:hypothetical protein